MSSEVQIAVIDQQDTQIVLAVPGVQGATGSNLPTGGTTNQVLRKASSTNYDTDWSLVTNAMVDSSAAIAGTKISPNFGSQNVVTTGTSTAASFIPTSSSVPTNGVYLPSANNVAISTNGTGRLFVDASGNISINTSSPGAGFDVNNSAFVRGGQKINGYFSLNAGDGVTTNIGTSGGINYIQSVNGATPAELTIDANPLVFRGSSFTERMRLDSSGRLGLGTSSAENACLLTLQESASLGAALALRNRNSTQTWRIAVDATAVDDKKLAFIDGTTSTVRMTVTDTGLVGIGTSNPSSQLHCTGDIKFGDAITLSRNFLTGLVTIADTTTEPYTQGFAFRTNETDEAYRFQNGDGTSTYLTIRGSGNVGIGTTAPSAPLAFADTAGTAGDPSKIALFSATGTPIYGFGVSANQLDYVTGGSHVFYSRAGTTSTERARIDSSGRLLVGTSTNTNNIHIGNQKIAVVHAGENTYSGIAITGYAGTAQAACPVLSLARSRGTSDGSLTEVVADDRLGSLAFLGADGTAFQYAATIDAVADGDWTTSGDTTDNPGRLVFSTTVDGASSPTERMRIGNAGNLNTFADTQFAVALRSAKGAGTTDFSLVTTYSATNTLTGTIAFQVYTNGNVQNTNNSYGQISDVKLKENIVDANSQWDDLKGVKVRNFNFKEGQTHRQIGVIAQELEEVSPGLVYETPDRDAEGNDLGTVTKGVNYSVLYMKAVKALQEAMERIETLEAKVNALEGN